jgi:CRISPR/Cas system-associated protein endoribonuclease Cas2
MEDTKMTKDKKQFYTSDGVKIIGYSSASEFNKALEEWTKKEKHLEKHYPEEVKKMKMTESNFKEEQ